MPPQPLSAGERERLAGHIAAELRRAATRVAGLSRRFDDIVRSAATDAPDDEHDPEGATIAYERAQVGALLARAERDVAQLRDARDRLRAGDDGACTRCGGAIGVDRLMARPATRTCVTCAAAR